MRGRALAGIGAGAVSWLVPASLADEVTDRARAEADAALAAAGERVPRRRFRALPPRLGVYFLLGLCLYSHLPCRQVLRELSAGLGGALAAAGWPVPSPTALTGLRRRLGERPLELLFWRVAGPLCQGREPWSLVCGLLAVAWDGTTVKVPASPANIAAFGRPRHGGGTGKGGKAPAGGAAEGAYPQARLVTLVACGTRALLGAATGPFTAGERTLAGQLAGQLKPGMLLLADRGFFSFGLWNASAAAGAHLLWRVSSTLRLPVVTALPDGSFLSRVNDPAQARLQVQRNRRARARGISGPPETGPLPGAVTVRVIEFTIRVTLDDGSARTERYRMITTLLGWRACPAPALAAGYARRWAIETSYREFKAYLRGPGRILRSRTPDLARQEIWAYLITCQAIRAVTALAAAGQGLDPARLSFTAALHAIRRTGQDARRDMNTALTAAAQEILAQPVPEREHRVCPRAVNEPVKPFPSRRGQQHPLSQHARYTITVTPPGQTTTPATDQPRQPGNQENQPP
jgi:Insertion element 4 transposase N-terminal/Transposase DDE domain